MGFVRFAVKSTLAGGIVYYSVQQGLWSKSEDSVQLYGKVYNNVAPYIKDNIPKKVVSELPPMLSASELCNSVKSTWNKGVIASMKFLSETPTHVSNGIESVSKTMGQFAEQQRAAEKSQ
ncbi:PREDICTED: uncharacterized protein LOC106746264 isoform X3 [Dinoponera quadriceps]|uniref:MICOS complex subunit MIC13 n=1 Tax=Dinoponera quadriceps TaxID=609295 RepID=A0A6P3XJG0_DINQU|nr:PREDICTED: uncharacterized protein LOC106746264 isoform X3 [Dinoponera quadriceps]